MYPMIVLTIYFIGSEIYQFLKMPSFTYFFEWDNIVQDVKSVLVLVIISSHTFEFDYLELTTCRRLAVLAIFLVYVDMFYWLKMFPTYAIVVRVLENTIKELLIFLSIFVLCVIGFSNVIFLLNQGRLSVETQILPYD